MRESRKPIIAITMGDPAGIGPEIIAKGLAKPWSYKICRPVVVGDAGVMKTAIGLANLRLQVNILEDISRAKFCFETVDVLSLHNVNSELLEFGKVSKMAGQAAFEYIKKGAELALDGKVDAVLSGPINKLAMNEAGYQYRDQTQLFSKLTNTEEEKVVTMATDGTYRVFMTVKHVSIKKVPDYLTRERILLVIETAHRVCKKLGISDPRIAVTCLNPHCGEGGLFGREEIDRIEPVVRSVIKKGIRAIGPMSASLAYQEAKDGKCNAIVLMHEDQSLGLSLLTSRGISTVSVGLPIIRTTVGHGTAFEIAGRGIADPKSFLATLDLTAKLSRSRVLQNKTGD